MSIFPENTINTIYSHLEISSRNHDEDYAVPNHWHDYFEFEIVTDGSYSHTISGNTYIASRGCAWIISHLDYHAVKCLESSSLINISFTPDAVSDELCNILSSYAGGFPCRFDEETTRMIIELCKDAKKELEEKPLLWKSTVNAAIEGIIARTIRKSKSDIKKEIHESSDVVQKAIMHINKHFASDVSISASSRLFGISPGRLGLLFSTKTGMSYNSYVNRVRLRHACNLLTTTEKTAKEIAFDCGYSSVEYFFYIFKKLLSVTPQQYRQISISDT